MILGTVFRPFLLLHALLNAFVNLRFTLKLDCKVAFYGLLWYNFSRKGGV